MEYSVGKCLDSYGFEEGDVITDYTEKFTVIKKNEKIVGVNKKVYYTYDIRCESTGEVFKDLSKLKVFIKARKKPKYIFKEGDYPFDSTWKVLKKHYLLFTEPGLPGNLYDVKNEKTGSVLKLLTANEIKKLVEGKNVDSKKIRDRLEYNKTWITRLNKVYLKNLTPYKL